MIQKLYGVERRIRAFPVEHCYAYRQQHAQPILEKLRSWLDKSLPNVPSDSATGKALNYLYKDWGKLVRYLEDGRLTIDSNQAENAIRPFVVGRKNSYDLCQVLAQIYPVETILPPLYCGIKTEKNRLEDGEL